MLPPADSLEFLRELAGVVGRKSNTSEWASHFEAISGARDFGEPFWDSSSPQGFVAAEHGLARYVDALRFFASDRWLDAVRDKMSGTYLSRTARSQRRMARTGVEYVKASRKLLSSRFLDAAAASDKPLCFVDKAALEAVRMNFVSSCVVDASINCPSVDGLKDLCCDIREIAKKSILSEGVEKFYSQSSPLAPQFVADQVHAGRVCEEGDVNLQSFLPRSKAYVYDMNSLLNGIPGNDSAGLNYKTVRHMKTIREVSDVSEEMGNEINSVVAATREDAPGVFRELLLQNKPLSSSDLESILVRKSHVDEYNNLTSDAVFHQKGFLLDYDRLKQSFDSEPNQVGNEIKLFLDPSADGDTAADFFVSSKLESFRDVPYAPDALPGAIESLRREAAVSYLMQSVRVGNARRRKADVASCEDAAPLDLKLFAAVHGRSVF